MLGTFIECVGDRHVALRAATLNGERSWNSLLTFRCHAGELAARLDADLGRQLALQGIICAALDRPLTIPEFVAVGARLGTCQPETDPSVAPFTEAGFVLNLLSRYEETENVGLQPFSVGSLNLHTESSGKPLVQQPRYIALMCCELGDEATASATVLAPMAEVEERLAPRTLPILMRTWYRRNVDGPTIARRDGGRVVFSFRDFGHEPLEWAHDGEAADPDEVRDAIADLLAAMYGATDWRVAWQRGLLAVVGNGVFFHGKTRARGVSDRPRRLQRLRII